MQLPFAVGIAEGLASFGLGFTHPDMVATADAPPFTWQLASMGFAALLGAGVALTSADPVRST